MRRTLALLLLSLVVFAGVPARAGEQKGVATTRGQVRSVNVEQRTFVLEPDDGADVMTVRVDEHTKIVRNGEETRLEDLSAGDHLAMSYHKDDEGRFVALSVAVGSPSDTVARAGGSLPD